VATRPRDLKTRLNQLEVAMNSRIRFFVAATLLAAGSAAHALPIAQYNEADTANQVTLRIGGATAVDPGLERLWQVNVANSGVCANGSLDFFRSADRLHRLAFCTGSTNLPGALQGKRLAIFKASTGGSGNGVGPMVRNTLAIPYWDPATITTTLGGCAGVTRAATGSFAQWVEHDACANTGTVSRTPDAGISDLEPAIFKTAFTPALLNSELAAIPPLGIAGVAMGVPVSLNIYKRLQALSFSAGSVCNPGNAGYNTDPDGAGVRPANGESQDCMPSLTRSQAAALYANFYTSWDLILSTDGATSVGDVAGAGIPALAGAPGDHPVYVCRRVDTSGTQNTFQTYFLGQRCSGETTFISATSEPTRVREGSGSGQVVQCFNGTLPANNLPANAGIIGTLSLEFQPGSQSANDNWRFVKLDGVAGCVPQIIKSKYNFIGESTFQWRTSTVPANGTTNTAALPALSGNPLSLASQVQQKMSSPAVISDIDSGFRTANAAFNIPVFRQCVIDAGGGTFVNTGGALFSDALNNTAPTPPYVFSGGGAGDVLANPVLTKTHGPNGSPNACSPSMIDVQSTVIDTP